MGEETPKQIIGLVATIVAAVAITVGGFFWGRPRRSRSNTDAPIRRANEGDNEASPVRDDVAKVQTRDLGLDILQAQLARRSDTSASTIEGSARSATEDNLSRDRFFGHPAVTDPAQSTSDNPDGVDQQVAEEDRTKDLLQEVSEQKRFFFGTGLGQVVANEQIEPDSFNDQAKAIPQTAANTSAKHLEPHDNEVRERAIGYADLPKEARGSDTLVAALEAKDAFFGTSRNSAAEIPKPVGEKTVADSGDNENHLLKVKEEKDWFFGAKRPDHGNETMTSEGLGAATAGGHMLSKETFFRLGSQTEAGSSVSAGDAGKQITEEEKKKNFLQEVSDLKDFFFGGPKQQEFEKKPIKPDGFEDILVPEPPAAADAVVKQMKPEEIQVQERAIGDASLCQDTRGGDIFVTDLDSKDAMFGSRREPAQLGLQVTTNERSDDRENFLLKAKEEKDLFFGKNREDDGIEAIKPEGFHIGTQQRMPRAEAPVTQGDADQVVQPPEVPAKIENVVQDTRTGDILSDDMAYKDWLFGIRKDTVHVSGPEKTTSKRQEADSAAVASIEPTPTQVKLDEKSALNTEARDVQKDHMAGTGQSFRDLFPASQAKKSDSAEEDTNKTLESEDKDLSQSQPVVTDTPLVKEPPETTLISKTTFFGVGKQSEVEESKKADMSAKDVAVGMSDVSIADAKDRDFGTPPKTEDEANDNTADYQGAGAGAPDMVKLSAVLADSPTTAQDQPVKLMTEVLSKGEDPQGPSQQPCPGGTSTEQMDREIGTVAKPAITAMSVHEAATTADGVDTLSKTDKKSEKSMTNNGNDIDDSSNVAKVEDEVVKKVSDNEKSTPVESAGDNGQGDVPCSSTEPLKMQDVSKVEMDKQDSTVLTGEGNAPQPDVTAPEDEHEDQDSEEGAAAASSEEAQKVTPRQGTSTNTRTGGRQQGGSHGGQSKKGRGRGGKKKSKGRR